MERKRWPGWVYGTGVEPDYRFTLANERTMLAWVRTSLALIAAGVAVDAVHIGLSRTAERVVVGALVGTGVASCGIAWIRWAHAERAMRRGQQLPTSSALLLLICCAVVAVSGFMLVRVF